MQHITVSNIVLFKKNMLTSPERMMPIKPIKHIFPTLDKSASVVQAANAVSGNVKRKKLSFMPKHYFMNMIVF